MAFFYSKSKLNKVFAKTSLALLDWSTNVGTATIVGDDYWTFFIMMIVEGDVEFVSERIDDGSTDAKTSKGAGARKESNFSDALPSSVILF